MCACLALGGCDAVLRLEHVPDRKLDAMMGGSDVAPACVISRDDTMDEDCDGIDDSTDLCPTDSDPTSDGDSDGVGDECDPSALTSQRLLFDGFATQDAGWTSASGGPFTFDIGSTTDSSFDGTIVHAVTGLRPWLAETWIEVGPTNTSNPRVSLLAQTSVATVYGCEVTIGATSTLVIHNGGGGSVPFIGLGGRLRIAMVEGTSGLTCQAGYEHQSPVTLSAALGSFNLTNVQLQTGGIKASFDSVFVAGGP